MEAEETESYNKHGMEPSHSLKFKEQGPETEDPGRN